MSAGADTPSLIAAIQERAALDARVANELENLHEKVDGLRGVADASDSKLAVLVALETRKEARDIERLEMERQARTESKEAAVTRANAESAARNWWRTTFFEKVVVPAVTMLIGGATMWFTVRFGSK